MEYIQQINPDRIYWCCDDYGITTEQLAQKSGTSPKKFDSMLAGEGGLTFSQLRKIANYFHRGALFFLDPNPVSETQIRTPQFRTIESSKPDIFPELKALIERVEWNRDLYLSLREDLGEDDLRFDPPNLPPKNPKRAAEVVREWLDLGENNDFALYREAVESKGILVFRSMGYAGKWKIPDESQAIGFSLYHKKAPTIVVKKQVSEARQSFTLMHELGHLLLHRDSFLDEENNLWSHEGREQIANTFAGNLLVPDVFLDCISDEDRPENVAEFDEWLKPYGKKWGVSGEVILRRLLDSGRLDKAIYQAYRRWLEQRPFSKKTTGGYRWRDREPLHIFGKQFVATVFDSLHAKQISLSKASTYLDNLKIKDIHKLGDHVANL